MRISLFQLSVIYLTPLLARCQTPQEEALQNSLNGASFHADLPFLGSSKGKRWYLFLVISLVGAAFLEVKPSVKLELLAFKPTKEEELRVRALCKDQEAALQRERMRRTAQRDSHLHTLHTLRRLNSS
ncbi:hypothetical protein WJX75_007542 [Coccomyxa subellipsoidea]|uniref:Uncharacterized protein n=1 Tax=Coccomyxa subellipsoidea TaxID=248742 RepID=A0ABR2YB96_9CHLO